MSIVATPKGWMTNEGEPLDLTTLEDGAYALRELKAMRDQLSNIIKDLELSVAERMDEQGQRTMTVSNDGRTTHVEVGPPNATRLDGWDEAILSRLIKEEPVLPMATWQELTTFGLVSVNTRVANRLANTNDHWKRIVEEARVEKPARRKVTVS